MNNVVMLEFIIKYFVEVYDFNILLEIVVNVYCFVKFGKLGVSFIFIF